MDKELLQALAFGGHCPKCNDFLYAQRVNGKIVKECIHCDYSEKQSKNTYSEKSDPIEEVLAEARSFKNDTTGVLKPSTADIISHKRELEIKEFVQSFRKTECPCCHRQFGEIKVFQYFYEAEHIRAVLKILCPHCHSVLSLGAIYEFMTYGRSRHYIKPEIAIVKNRAEE